MRAYPNKASNRGPDDDEDDDDDGISTGRGVVTGVEAARPADGDEYIVVSVKAMAASSMGNAQVHRASRRAVRTSTFGDAYAKASLSAYCCCCCCCFEFIVKVCGSVCVCAGTRKNFEGKMVRSEV